MLAALAGPNGIAQNPDYILGCLAIVQDIVRDQDFILMLGKVLQIKLYDGSWDSGTLSCYG